MADFTVRQWMETDDAAQREAIVKDLAGTMDLGLLFTSTLLPEFQPYLGGDASLTQAADAMELLSKILTTLQADLGRQDVHIIVEYLSNRFENKDDVPSFQAGIKWTAKSLSALAKMEARFPRGDASIIAKAVFKLASTCFREQLPTTRLAVFELLNFLRCTYSTPIIRDLGAQSFVGSLVAMAEFEKDPRCLKLLFLIYQDIGQQWVLPPDSFELMWESYSRYFPITLKTTDTSIPSREELQLLLIGCFASNDSYAVHTFPHLFDGLDTTEDTLTAYVKNTVLETLEACVNAYSTKVAAQWCSKIWDALKFEIWDGTNEEFIGRALNVIKAVGRKLDDGSLDWEDTTSPFAHYMMATSTDCSHRLHDSQPQHVLGSGKILCAVASSSIFGFHLVMKNVLPKMFVIWDGLTLKDKKTAILSVFNNLLQAGVNLRDGKNNALSQGHNVKRYPADVDATLAASLTTFQRSIVDDVLINAMMEVGSGDAAIDTPYKVNAIKGLVIGARIPAFLSDYHKGSVILEFSKLAANPFQSEQIHNELIHALQQISVEDVARFRDLTLPTFIADLPDRLRSSKAEFKEDVNAVVFILESLIQIGCTAICKVEVTGAPSHPETTFKFRVFEQLQEALLKKLHRILSLPDQLPYANAILAAIYHGVQLFDEILNQEQASGNLPPSPLPETGPLSWIIKNIFEKLAIQKFHLGGPLDGVPYIALNINLDSDSTVNDLFFDLLGRLTTIVLRSNQTTAANNFLLNADRVDLPSQVWNLFCLDPPADSIPTSQQNLEYGPEDKCFANILSMSLVAGLRREETKRLKIHIGITALSMVMNAIRTERCSPLARISMLQFLQLLINKFGATKERLADDQRNLVQVMLDLVTTSTSKDELEVQRTYQTLSYFTAACLASGDGAFKDLISQMIIGVSNSMVGRKVAQSFRILLAPSEVMTEQNFCILRKLRKQRLFQLTVDQLILLWRTNSSKTVKENALIALAGVLAQMDSNVLNDNGEKIIPFILEGTNVDDDYTMYTNISLIHHLVTTCSEIASSRIDSIINRMIDRTHNTYDSPSDASVKCRAAALEVLALLVTHMERGVLIRRKAKIMSELDVALDDCSRTVRSAAERTKMRWFNLVENEG